MHKTATIPSSAAHGFYGGSLMHHTHSLGSGEWEREETLVLLVVFG
jgi:hypothetical protein